MKKVFAIVMVGMLAVVGVTGVFVQEDDEFVPAPNMDDGRINAYDPAAPVAIFTLPTRFPLLMKTATSCG